MKKITVILLYFLSFALTVYSASIYKNYKDFGETDSNYKIQQQKGIDYPFENIYDKSGILELFDEHDILPTPSSSLSYVNQKRQLHLIKSDTNNKRHIKNNNQYTVGKYPLQKNINFESLSPVLRSISNDHEKLGILSKYYNHCAPDCNLNNIIGLAKIRNKISKLNDDLSISKLIYWTAKYLENLKKFNLSTSFTSSSSSSETVPPEYYSGLYSGINLLKNEDLSGRREGPFYAEEPNYVIVRREEEYEPKMGTDYMDDPFIPPRGRKHSKTPALRDLLDDQYELFIPNRGKKKDDINDIFKYDELFFPNRGKRQIKQIKSHTKPLQLMIDDNQELPSSSSNNYYFPYDYQKKYQHFGGINEMLNLNNNYHNNDKNDLNKNKSNNNNNNNNNNDNDLNKTNKKQNKNENKINLSLNDHQSDRQKDYNTNKIINKENSLFEDEIMN